MTFDVNSVLFLLMRGDINLQYIAVFLLAPFIGKMLESLVRLINSFYEEKFNKKWTHIDFEGSPGSFGAGYSKAPSDYSLAFRSISHYVSENCNCTSLKEARGGEEPFKFAKFVVDNCRDFDIGDGMFIDSSTVIPTNNGKGLSNETPVTTLRLRSKTKTIIELKEFVSECIKIYNTYSSKMNKNKIYHFVYKGSRCGSPRFSSTVISDLASYDNRNPETFEHIFNEHKSSFIDDMELLADTEYYINNGLKRKKGYLFYGDPGCGKTYSVMAMANHSQRHIIEVPMSRVKTNEELEDIINSDSINSIPFDKSQVIILFDEIDCGSSDSLKVRDSMKSGDKSSENTNADKTNIRDYEEDDKLSLGTILSRLDGIGSYDGIIFIATTNCIDDLDPALYRHGRLDPYYFTYSRRQDIKAMIEKAFKIELTAEQVATLPDREAKIPPSTVKKYIHDYRKNLDDLITKLCELDTKA